MEKLDPLQTFVEVVRVGSFSGAARSLSMPRSTVSLHIRTLEGALGVRLLKRSTRSLSLTDDGHRLFSQVENGLQVLVTAMENMRTNPEELRGLIRLAAPADFPTNGIASAISGFRQAHPAVRFDLLLGAAAVDLVRDNVDIALRIGVRGDLGRVERKLSAVSWLFCASPGWIDRNDVPTDLDGVTEFVSPSRDLRTFLEQFVLGGRKLPASAIMADNQLMVRDLAIAGAGVALLPEGLCAPAFETGCLVPVLPDMVNTAPHLKMAFPSRADMTPHVRAFADALTEQFKRQLV